jgi:hypothetical protein
VYFIYDPKHDKYSLGKVNWCTRRFLRDWASYVSSSVHCERPHWLEKCMMQVLLPCHHLPWVRYQCRYWYAHLSCAHLTSGFYIHSCPKMKYKGGFSPSYLADPVSNDVTDSSAIWSDPSANLGRIYVVSFGGLYSATRKVSLCRFRAPRKFVGRSTGSWWRYDWMVIW